MSLAKPATSRRADAYEGMAASVFARARSTVAVADLWVMEWAMRSASVKSRAARPGTAAGGPCACLSGGARPLRGGCWRATESML